MRIAILSPVAWRTSPLHYGPWENVASLKSEELVARSHDVTPLRNRKLANQWHAARGLSKAI